MSKPKFTKVSPNEILVDYKGKKFMLTEQTRGVYGIGRAVQLYLVEEFERKHIKEVGWTQSDNHSCRGMKDALIQSITNMDSCKTAAIKYIDLVI